MNAKLAICACLFFFADISNVLGQQDHVGAGYALSFDGVDDYIDLGNIYDGLQLPLTISAWINVDPGGLGTIFASQDNTHIYSGFHFFVVHTAIIIEYGDGMGTNSTEFRRGKAGPVENIFGKWVHVAAVMRNANDMDVYLNGINLGGTYIGTSQSPMASSFPEVAKIGYRATSGVIYHYKGAMDELRIWNRALTEQQIRDQMCRKLTGNEPGLIGYWDFDQTRANVLVDNSTFHFDGAIRGEPSRIFSGAPVGDQSVALYTDNWTDKLLTLEDNLTTIKATNVEGNPGGVHLYKVNDFPLQHDGLNSMTVSSPYYGVFTASTNTDSDVSCDVGYAVDAKPVCRLYTRTESSTPSWEKNAPQLKEVSQRMEFIHELHDTDLGVNLGEDDTLCTFTQRILQPLQDTVGFKFEWQDGSEFSELTASEFGTYWVSVDNGCTSAVDTVSILSVDAGNVLIPNVFTPNGDPLNQFFQIDNRLVGSVLTVFDRWGRKVYHSTDYQNAWDGDDLPSGVYFYTLNGGECIEEMKGTLTILK